MTRFLLTIILLSTSLISLAQQVITDAGQTYKLHTVAKGESFYRLCLDYSVSQEDIISANPSLKNTGLVEGVVIRIPLNSKNNTNKATAAYTVKKGDTAFSIAKQYGMSVPQLISLNPSITSGLREGQTITVLTQNSPNPSSNTSKEMVDYTVQRGETMFSISQRHGLSVPQLLALNPAATTGIKAGDIIKVPSLTSQAYAIHIISAGETLYAIGRRYGVKAQQIIDANLSLNPASLPVGTAIRIPHSSIPNEDDNFFYHRIAKGETLYSLCVKYNILQDKITSANPTLDWNTLQIGQVIAIPKEPKSQTTYTDHEVEKRETLYSISRLYSISIDELTNANPGLTADNLKRGMTIKIPHTTAPLNATPATTDTSYIGLASTVGHWGQGYDYITAGRPNINVFLMLPFNAYSEMNELRNSRVNVKTQSYPFKSHRYIEFYEGVRMALDSLSQAGANITLRVLDTNNRLEAINQLNTAPVTPDIIIGPAHRDEMADVMRYANDKRVPVVLPFAQCDSTILDNPYIFQASVIDSISGLEILSQMVNNLSPDQNVIMLTSRSKSQQYKFRTQTMRSLCANANIPLKEYEYKTSNPHDFLLQIADDKPNIIFVPSNNEATVNSTLTSLSGILEQKPDATVELWATSEWLAFQTIEIDVFHNLNTRIYTTFAVDESNPHTRYALNTYRKLYNTEPIAFMPYFQKLKPLSGFSEYGLWGYDVALKFVGALISKGPSFPRDINSFNPPTLQSNFQFRNLTNWGGAVNVGLKTISFTPSGDVKVANVL